MGLMSSPSNRLKRSADKLDRTLDFAESGSIIPRDASGAAGGSRWRWAPVLGFFCHTAATRRRASLSRSSCVRWARRIPPALASKAGMSWGTGLMVGSLISTRSMVVCHVWGSRFPDRTVCGLTSLGNRLTCQAGKLVRALQAGAQGIGIVWKNRLRWTPEMRQVAMRESCFYKRLRNRSSQ